MTGTGSTALVLKENVSGCFFWTQCIYRKQGFG